MREPGNHDNGASDVWALTHPRTGFIIRRIKSLFHHSNWQHIFLISFNGTSKRDVMHYKKKIKKKLYDFLVKHCQFA